MPYGDGTGPSGLGPMSGRSAGYCAGFGRPGYANPSAGWGFGRGLGRGRGFGGGGHRWRHWFNATGLPGWKRMGGFALTYGHPAPYLKLDPDIEKQALETQLETLQKELEIINKRLSGLKTNSSAE